MFYRIIPGASSSSDIKKEFLPHHKTHDLNYEKFAQSTVTKERESIVDIKNTSTHKLRACSFICNDGNLVNFNEEPKSCTIEILTVNEKDQMQDVWNVNILEKKLPENYTSSHEHMVISADLSYFIIVSHITLKGKNDEITKGYTLSVYKLSQDKPNADIHNKSEFIGMHFSKGPSQPNKISLSATNVISVGVYENCYLVLEHYRIILESEVCVKFLGSQRIHRRFGYSYFRYNTIGDVLIITPEGMYGTTPFISFFYNVSSPEILNAVESRIPQILSSYYGRNSYIFIYDSREYLVCNKIDYDHADGQECFIKVVEFIRRKNGTFLFKGMYLLDTEPFINMKIVGADGCNTTPLVACQQIHGPGDFLLINPFKKYVAYKINSSFVNLHHISLEFRQFGYLCNEVFMMCRNSSNRFFMKVLTLENKFPSLFDITLKVMLKNFTFKQLEEMNLQRVCKNILHYPFANMVD